MFDLALNSNFSVHLDDRNDIAVVEGRDAFEQSVVITLTEFMHESLPGLSNGDALEQKIRLEVTRVAREHDRLQSIATLNISKKDDAPDTYTVEIVYTSDVSFSTDITAQ